MSTTTMDKLISLAKRRGYIYQGSEIYGGLANSWDYGPFGVEFKNNIKRVWWKSFVQKRFDVVGLDSAILMNPTIWEASGHVGSFSDPLMDCKECKTRHRADKLLEDHLQQKGDTNAVIAGLSLKELQEQLVKEEIQCPDCGAQNFTEIRHFNLMFKTFQGVTEDTSSEIFLRPETAQGIFVNFKNIYTTSRRKVPFGIAQIGKSFRNEITPGNFIFRTREFEQMELEYFCHPDDSLEQHASWKEFCFNWLIDLGLRPELLKMRDHSADELSHYSSATSDIEFQFPFGWGELWGIAHRGDYDLRQHQEYSKKDLTYHDPATNEKYLPHVIEPSLGVDRVALAFLLSAYEEQQLENDTRTVLRLNAKLAPIKVAILPLSKKLNPKAMEVFHGLADAFMCDYDETGSIGKRYRRQDEIGTPWCVTVDFDTMEDHSVTLRDRDTMEQIRLRIDELRSYILAKLL